jgi:hypothetical protein
MLERDIERICREYAVHRGAINVKTAYTFAGWPDRMFILPNGVVWFVEFKTVKGKLTERQKMTIQALRDRKQIVNVVRSTSEFKLLFDSLARSEK